MVLISIIFWLCLITLIAPKHLGRVVVGKVTTHQIMNFIALIGVETHGIN